MMRTVEKGLYRIYAVTVVSAFDIFALFAFSAERKTVDILGDLQGIAGKALHEIEGLGLPARECGKTL